MNDRLWSRKDFLKFMGRGAAAVPAATILGGLWNGCRGPGAAPAGIAPSAQDALLLAAGLSYDIVVREGDIIQNERGLRFGTNNDYLALLPDRDGRSDRLVLWANHETPTGLYYAPSQRFLWRPQNAGEFAAQRAAVGGSRMALRRDSKGKWNLDAEDARNFRIDATTPIALTQPIDGVDVVEGSFGNCAGGLTPWGTILTCEENHIYYYGDSRWDGRNVDFLHESENRRMNWQKYRPGNRPNHYGWVVEVDPHTAAAKKHVSLGRWFHECATVAPARDYETSGLAAVYSGDDVYGGCIYKFLSTKAKSLEQGRLFVASFETSPRADAAAEGVEIRGRWVELSVRDPRLARFRNQQNVLIHARQAAQYVGGTPQDRPEDIEIDPFSGDVYVTLTYNARKAQPNHFGSILRIREDDADPFALTFTASVFKSGGNENGFACPDNLAFDPRGNLWMVSDISENSMNQGPYASFQNNGLFFIPMSGPEAGRVIQVGSAPVDAEFTGPCFSPDGRTLFLSVQHPGLRSTNLTDMTSRWPDGDRPKSAVVTISGELLDRWAAV